MFAHDKLMQAVTSRAIPFGAAPVRGKKRGGVQAVMRTGKNVRASRETEL